MIEAPSIEAARAMGEKGSPPVEAERLAFEAWMAGHCWPVLADWNGKEYLGSIEKGWGMVCPHASKIRQMWAAWRDRAALTPNVQAVGGRFSGSRTRAELDDKGQRRKVC